MQDEHLIEIKEVEADKKEAKKEKEEKENFATEVFCAFDKLAKCVIAIVAAGWAITAIVALIVIFRNDDKWRDLFNSYDYISQDGGGFNNINSGEQGDLNNGSESKVEEE